MKRNLGLITALLMTLPYGCFPASADTPIRQPQPQEEKTMRLTKADKKRERKLQRNRRLPMKPEILIPTTSLNSILELNPDQGLWFTLLRHFKKLAPDDQRITFSEILKVLGICDTVRLLPAGNLDCRPGFLKLVVKVIRKTWHEQLSRNPTLNIILFDAENIGLVRDKMQGEDTAYVDAPLFEALGSLYNFGNNAGQALKEIINLALDANKHNPEGFLKWLGGEMQDVFSGVEKERPTPNT